MKGFYAFSIALVYGVNKMLIALVPANFIQGALMANRAYMTGKLSLIGTISFCVVVSLVCVWHIYIIHKHDRELMGAINKSF